jgi:hypothetical protein
MKDAYIILVGTPEGERPLERTRHRCDDNIKINFKKMECESVDWIHLVQGRV